ncbi:phenylalanyl-tRNA synthetase, alpha subunit [Desulfonispora thiosulfatigenes DSM 11270]|uniref:Phenylalanine--tRNA ligase alpha subunit n=1 Tax=Desulfonispora thiosulfatigenes DSM 11270 TaxID=656914 RepID=A0A1W1VRJ5_DESTI|nr:phenylalanine--tRNA ligase subunit alpha [Desulfonispora thiosulfatigenes]SMB95979.1 phenylalanyl-tRNA synthetase, alpha subunit [Desulfonispora thiosulfatigenes DSM 11270]
MRQELEKIKAEAANNLKMAECVDNLNNLKVKYLGKKGELTSVLRGMGKLSEEERPIIGQLANEIRDELNLILDKQLKVLKENELNTKLAEETIDVTLTGKDFAFGSKHPITKVIDETKQIFMGLGFEIAEGPEIETDYYNFEALNLPKDHPARDMQDSFYITPDVLLRTHTSPVQVRTMNKKAPAIPLKIICPGKVYRKDDDATHSPMFHQIEGLVIDKNIKMSDLKGVLLNFARQMFGTEREIRLRPSFFPFTEPSAEVDISCGLCEGKGCRACSHTGWLEILGSGMVHPNVLKFGGYDPNEVTGFAFGMGVERIAMLKYGINDLRLMYENDIRFLRQF